MREANAIDRGPVVFEATDFPSRFDLADVDAVISRPPAGYQFAVGMELEGRGLGPGGDCVCPNCGEKASHERGTPCFEVKCPKCGTPMTRS